MKTYLLICLAGLVIGPLFAQTPARKPTAARKPAPASRPAATPATTTRTAATPAPAPAASPRTQAVPPQRSTNVAEPVAQTVQVAKSTTAGIRFGIIGGGNLSSMAMKGVTTVGTSGVTVEVPYSTVSPGVLGFHAGLLVDIPVGERFSLQPNLLYSTKGGGGNSINPLSADYFPPITLSYVELPVTLFYHIPLGSGRLGVGAGPYVAYGLTGKFTFPLGYNDGNLFESNTGILKRIDYGVRGAIQYELRGGFLLGATYSLGLAELVNVSFQQEENSLKTRNIGFSLGYVFGSGR